jgi:DNA-binding winged helix-turn-helix (wHTH) protein
MIYSIGIFVLDTGRELLLHHTSKEIVSNHSRTVKLLGLLAEAYPKVVSKNELMQKLWRDDDVTDWALSRQIYQLRQLLSAHDPETQYIKTVHTQGFKLEIEPRIIDPVAVLQMVSEQQSENPEPELIDKPRYRFGKWLIPGAIVCLLLLSIFAYHWLKTPPLIYGEILPPKTISLPVNAQWTSSKPDTLQFTADGILIAPIELDPLYVSTSLTGPAFYQGAIFSVDMKLSQEFVDNKGGLRFYYQSTQDGWPGEWDCILDDFESLEFEYQCRVDENGAFTKIRENETVNFGVKLHQLQPIGNAIIKSADINLPASISTDKGWRTTNNLTLEYDRGVSFKPKSLAAKLATSIRGPVNISGSKIAFTLEVEDSYKNSDVGIQLFLIGQNGDWHDCFIEGENIQFNVFTKICDFKNIKNPFVLKENEKIEIGVSPFGKFINGKIKIVGITLSE